MRGETFLITQAGLTGQADSDDGPDPQSVSQSECVCQPVKTNHKISKAGGEYQGFLAGIGSPPLAPVSVKDSKG